MLWRNFGVTGSGRVVFYDYDEIEYLYRHQLPSVSRTRPTPKRSSPPSPGTASPHNDVFPEEFATFLLGDPRLRQLFLRHHADLLEPEYWQAVQQRIESGKLMDFFPYPESLRFRNRQVAAT